MPDLTKDLIVLENPDQPETGFRQNNQGKTNRVSTINYGNGVKGKVGLLRGSGHEAVYAYTFDDEKYDDDSAQEWLDNHRSKKAMKKLSFKNKKLKFTMPLIKGEMGDDGYYYLKFGLSTDTVDLEKEQVDPLAIDDMIEQAKLINAFECHQYGLDDVLGPIVDSWKEKVKNINMMMIKVRVIPSFKDKIKELVDAGVRLGGSFGGTCLEDQIVDGVRILKKILLLEGSLTPLPVNWDTLGTAEETTKACKNGMCTQIVKSIRDKYDLPEEKKLEVKNVTRTEDESYDAIMSAVSAAVNQKYRGPDGYSNVWLKLTFPESCIIGNWEEDKLYELPYTIDEGGNVALGDPVEVQEQYVEKKLEVFKTKAIEHEKPADYKKTIGDENMDETKVQKMIDDSNAKLLGEIKGLIKPEKEVEETPAIDAAKMTKSITEDVTKNLLKSFGIEEEEEAVEDGKIVIMDQKALEDLQADAIQKTILGIAKQREGTRKSKSLGSSKFEIPGESEEESPEKTKSGKVSTRKAAEMVAERKGLA